MSAFAEHESRNRAIGKLIWLTCGGSFGVTETGRPGTHAAAVRGGNPLTPDGGDKVQSDDFSGRLCNKR